MFITFEGIEGSGKSTIIRRVGGFLQEYGHEILLTREPGGSSIGSEIRSMLLNRESQNLTAQAELYLFLADRAQHMAETVIPALQAGKIVLCDRFQDSTIAYQGYGRGMGLARLRETIASAALNFRPDLTLLLDLPAETGLARAQKRNMLSGKSSSEGRFEAEAIDFHARVRNGFLALHCCEPERIKLIDASQDIDEVYRACLKIVAEKMALR